MKVKLYQKKPMMVKALQWDGNNDTYEEIIEWSQGKIFRETRNVLLIPDGDTYRRVFCGDWLVEDMADRFIAVNDDFFAELYTDKEI